MAWPVLASRGALLPLIGVAVIAAASCGIAAGIAAGSSTNTPGHSVVMLHQESVLRQPVGAQQRSGASDRRPIAANGDVDYVHPDIATPTVDNFPNVSLDLAEAEVHVIAEADRSER